MKRTYDGNVWISIERAPDVPGEWVAQCLEFDVVTQGASIGDALKMAQDAVTMVVVDDLLAARDPIDRRAPRAQWDDFWKKLRKADVQLPPNEIVPKDDTHIAFVAYQFVLHIECVDKKKPAPETREQLIPETREQLIPYAVASTDRESVRA